MSEFQMSATHSHVPSACFFTAIQAPKSSISFLLVVLIFATTHSEAYIYDFADSRLLYSSSRSEERRVGKACCFLWGVSHVTKDGGTSMFYMAYDEHVT